MKLATAIVVALCLAANVYAYDQEDNIGLSLSPPLAVASTSNLCVPVRDTNQDSVSIDYVACPSFPTTNKVRRFYASTIYPATSPVNSPTITMTYAPNYVLGSAISLRYRAFAADQSFSLASNLYGGVPANLVALPNTFPGQQNTISFKIPCIYEISSLSVTETPRCCSTITCQGRTVYLIFDDATATTVSPVPNEYYQASITWY